MTQASCIHTPIFIYPCIRHSVSESCKLCLCRSVDIFMSVLLPLRLFITFLPSFFSPVKNVFVQFLLTQIEDVSRPLRQCDNDSGLYK